MARRKITNAIRSRGYELLRNRDKNNLTLEQVAAECGVNVWTIYNWRSRIRERDELMNCEITPGINLEEARVAAGLTIPQAYRLLKVLQIPMSHSKNGG